MNRGTAGNWDDGFCSDSGANEKVRARIPKGDLFRKMVLATANWNVRKKRYRKNGERGKTMQTRPQGSEVFFIRGPRDRSLWREAGRRDLLTGMEGFVRLEWKRYGQTNRNKGVRMRRWKSCER
jgi:hypothetical protein